MTEDGETYNDQRAGADVEANAAQFYSQGADYAEWILCGDVEEWREYFETVGVDFDELLSDRTSSKARSPVAHLGLPEGIVVYVREDDSETDGQATFWKEGPGVPFIITHNATIIGNDPLGANRSKDCSDLKVNYWLGENLSFIGQLPVIIRGPVEKMDLVLPDDTNPNLCKAVEPKDLDLQEYIRAIGTVLGPDAIDAPANECRSILVAIGKK